MTRDEAETVGLQALAWLAADADLFGTFLGASGASASDAMEAAGRPEFLGAVLDFVMMEDAWVIAFCTENGHSFTTPQRARAALPGGAVFNWT